MPQDTPQLKKWTVDTVGYCIKICWLLQFLLKPLEAQNMDIMAALQTLLTKVRLWLQPRLDHGWQENKKEKKDNIGITASEVVSQPVKLHYG